MYNSRYRDRVEWQELVDQYGWGMLAHLGFSSWYQVEDYIRKNTTNPLVDVLRADPKKFMRAADLAGGARGFSLDGVSRIVIICQMVLYDQVGGPERDGKEKALRRHWYHYFKQFAQMFAFAAGKVRPNDDGVDEMVDIQWSGRLSKLYGEFVDSRKVDYRGMWIEDASRMMEAIGTSNALFNGLKVIVCVEKDSLFADFVPAAKALGAIGIISGKGKNSKAAAERLKRKLGLDGDPDAPILVITLSDFDHDGFDVIWPTFGEQLRRYFNKVYEARIGVMPDQVVATVENPWQASYQVKLGDRGYQEFAYNKALWWTVCEECGHETFVQGVEYDDDGKKMEPTGWAVDPCAHEDEYGDVCGGRLRIEHVEEPHGFEVESLRSADYYRAMVDAVIDLVDFPFIIERLRKDCQPSLYNVKAQIRERFLDDNYRYRKIKDAIRRLERAQDELTTALDEPIEEKARELMEDPDKIEELQAIGDDPEPDDFKDYVVQCGQRGYGEPWRPFSTYDRDDQIVAWLNEDDEFIESLAEIDIENFGDIVDEIDTILTAEDE